MKRLAIFFILSLLLIAGNSATVLSQDASNQNEETFVILFDESHYQFFTTDRMQTALTSLNDSLDTEDLDVSIDLVVQNDPFNSTNVQGADLVIIGNPGKVNGSLPTVDESEGRALDNLVDIGGSVLWMSNPVSHNTNITGHAAPLNDLMFPQYGVGVSTQDTDNTTVIVDEFKNSGNNTYVEITSDNFSEQTLVTEVNNITKSNGASFLYYGSHISEASGNPGPISANTSSTAYVLNSDFTIEQFQQSPRWMYARDYSGGEGRAMLVGSTIMFSDYQFDSSSTWVEQNNNLELFQNIVGWLLELTPLPEDQSIVTESFAYFVRTNIMYALLLGGGLFLGTFVMFVRQGRVKTSQVFDVFNESNSSKSKKKKKSQSKKKSSTKRSERRKRT